MVNAANSKSVLLIIRHSPYGSSLARASLDTALAAAAFEQPVQLLFMGDGVLQLVADQQSQAAGVKNIGKLLSSLPLYGIERVYVDTEAATRYAIQLSSAPIATEAVSAAEINRLMASCDHLLGF